MTIGATKHCLVIHERDPDHGRQGLDDVERITTRNAASRHISLVLTTIPPGTHADAHLHEAHETTIYRLSGRSCVWYGERMQHL